MKRLNIKKATKIAIKVALKTGSIITKAITKNKIISEETRYDIKLEIDKKAESHIIRKLLHYFPEHSILSEEIGLINNQSEYCWIVDPLDGTVNYYYDFPNYCTSIACYKINQHTDLNEKKLQLTNLKLQPLIGVVYAPATKELFWASKNNGCFYQRKKAQCNERNIDKSLILTTTGIPHEDNGTQATLIHELSKVAKKVRIMGATALDTARVSNGSASAFVQKGTNIWDFAASRVLVEEAGGYFRATANQHGKWDILASTFIIKDQLERILEGGV